MPVREEEVAKAITKLRNGKASGFDEICNEYVKHSVQVLTLTFCKLFNEVLDSGSTPNEWMIGLIKPLYRGKRTGKSVLGF